ncbi:DUF4870 family protein [Pasteurella bettyae]|uniref:Uncharacterized protein n=1 Tax=Pasteurella bettyae CCUG 2042 TaxID=1095749 RepID=I3D6K2_9PAST|nr:hypothetical protein [Pasteurella bettyae]EIJ67345.1 hypothetical protein HMPREF1052_0663 [Pasteurella bettyae CCUG 2042]SUB21290.1 Predicted membrane protein [Pasteurella bettyae]
MNEHIEQELNKLGQDKDRTYMYIIYGLFIFAVVFHPLAIIGVVLAFMKRDELTAEYKSHCNYLIKTFIVSFIGTLITFFALIFWIVFAWYIYRVANGFQNFYSNKSVNGDSWFK